MSARRAIDPEDDNVLSIGARELELRRSYGLADVTPDDRLRALCIFDLLAMLVVSSVAPEERLNYYPSFAKHPAGFVEEAIAELRRDGDPRRAIYPLASDELRAALREVNELAAFQAAIHRAGGREWRYRGFEDVRTWMFIREGHVSEEWR